MHPALNHQMQIAHIQELNTSTGHINTSAASGRRFRLRLRPSA